MHVHVRKHNSSIRIYFNVSNIIETIAIVDVLLVYCHKWMVLLGMLVKANAQF